MSPPEKILRVGHQEGVIVNDIEDLDNARTATKENIVASTESKSIADRDAVEHECYEGSRGSVQAVQVEGSKKASKDSKDCVEELVLVDLPNGSHTPDCLGSSKSGNSKDYSFVTHSGENLSSLFASVSEDKQQLNKSKTFPQNRKRKNGKSKKKTSKRRRTSLSYHSEAIEDRTSGVGVAQQCVRCCAGGGGGDSTQKNQSGTGNGQCTSAATGTCVVATNTHTTQQGTGCGGGGRGSGDGEDPNHHKKQLESNLSCQSGNTKKNKSQTSEEDMEVDAVGSSSKDSPMDVSESSKDGAQLEEKRTRPEEKPPEKESTHDMEQPTQGFLICWHCRINHSAVCKTKHNCTKCYWVEMYVNHCMPEGGNECDCRYCKLWPVIFQYHQPKCTISDCYVCLRANAKSSAPEVEEHVAAGVVPCAQEVLNVPVSATSLDPEEGAIVYCGENIQNWTHFIEHEDYTFKQKELVGKGAHGEVHEVELHVQFKHKYPQFSSKEVVVKKATVGDDEMAAYKAMTVHPNIVKTHAVVKKTDGNYKHLIVMEKCDMSLQHFLDEKSRRGEVLSIYEVMYYWQQVLDAVVFIHNLRIPIIQKDIKSGNVLLTTETNLVRAQLADFDAVKLLHNEYTQSGLRPRGTPCFIAPEVWHCWVHGRPADIYSMAMLLFEMLNRKEFRNLQRDVKKHLSVKSDYPWHLISVFLEDAVLKLRQLDAGLGELIRRCIQVDPAQRPTAVQLRDSPAVKKYSSAEVAPLHPGRS